MVTYQREKILTWTELAHRFCFAVCNESVDEIFISVLSKAKAELCLVSCQRLFTPLAQNRSHIFEVIFLGKFTKLKKTSINIVMPDRPSVCAHKQLGSNGRNFMKFSVVHFSNI